MPVSSFISKIITSLLVISIWHYCKLLDASVLPHVYCNKDFILMQLPLTSNQTKLFRNKIYWENLKLISVKECQISDNLTGNHLKIFLKDFNKCGFTKTVNKLKHYVSYHQNLIITENDNSISRINVKCFYKIKKAHKNHILVKREALPPDFKEDEDIEILDTIEQQAPIPEVSMQVRQNDQLIDREVTVIPGTPLVMEVKLNERANEIYGLSIKYLEVTDMAEMSETILFKGCTVDPYLFENFNLTETNALKSKFRAFKFPDTAFVQFRANIKICLNKCLQPQCIGGKSKENRTKRDLTNENENLYEINTSLVLKLNETSPNDQAEFLKLQNHVKQLHTKNLQHLA